MFNSLSSGSKEFLCFSQPIASPDISGRLLPHKLMYSSRDLYFLKGEGSGQWNYSNRDVCKQFGGTVRWPCLSQNLGSLLARIGTADELIILMVYQAHSALLGVLKWDHLSQARFTPKFSFLSVTVYSLDGILVFGLLFVCTCAYFKKVPRLKTWLLSEKKGVWGVFYKGKIISGQGEEIAISGQWGATKWGMG